MALLYKANETDFSHLGLGPLNDAISILVTEERNGIFELEMKYPVSGKLFNELKNDRLIKTDAGHKLKDQRFKIIRITKPLDGIVTVYAEHVSYLTQDLALKPKVTFTGDARQALEHWKDNLVDDNPFTVWSDITTVGSINWSIDEVENARRALGGVQGSILDVYGGEYQFDNYDIYLYQKRGVKSEALIAYGRNLVDLEQDEEIANTYTSIYPFSIYTDDDENERMVTLPEYYIDSPYVNNYARRKILAVDFSDQEIKTVDALRNAANRYIENNNIGVPKVNLKIKFLDLSKTLDYKHLALLEEVNLCDEVTVYFEEFDINTTAKVIKVVWDALQDRYDSIEVGDARSSFSQAIDTVVDERVEKTERLSMRAIRTADGKNTIYYGLEEPTGDLKEGDLWFRVVDGEYTRTYRYDGVVWQLVLDMDSQEAKQEARQAKDEAQQAVDRANQATQQATDAINQAQTAFDEAQEALGTANNAVSIADSAFSKAQEGFGEAQAALGTANNAMAQATSAFTTASEAFSEVESLSEMVDENTGEISTIKQSVIGLQTQVSDNAGNISSLTQIAQGLQTQVTDIEGNVTTLQQTAQGLQSSVTNLQNELDGLEIGGRNLLRNSNFLDGFSQWRYFNNTPSSLFEVVDGILTVSTDGSNPSAFGQSFSKDADAYVVQIRARGSGRIRVRWGAGTRSDYQDVSDSFAWYIFKLDGNGNNNLIFEVVDGIVEIDKAQLEKGNRATDWTPAPEDIDHQFSEITQTIDSITTRVGDAEGNITALQQTSSSLAGRLSDAEGNITTLTATVDGLQTTVSNIEIGGRNLFSPRLFIENNDTGQPHRYSVGDNGELVITGTDGTSNQHYTKISSVIPGTNYVMSFSEGMNDRFELRDENGNEVDFLETKWVNGVEFYFKTPSNAVTLVGKFYPVNRNYPRNVFVKLEKGNKATDWTPAPEDIDHQFSEITQTIDSITTRVGDAEGNITALQQTSSSLAGRLSDAEGNITTLTATVDGLQTTVSNIEGDVSSVTQLANALQTRMTNAEGDISTLTQTASSLQSTIRSKISENLLVVEDLEVVFESGIAIWIVHIDIPDNTDYMYIKAHGDFPGTIPVIAYNFRDENGDFLSESATGIDDIFSGERLEIPDEAVELSFSIIDLLASISRSDIADAKIKIETGDEPTAYTPAGADTAVQSQITQLSDAINLRVEKGDVINQINLDTSGVLISGEKLILDGDTTVTGTFRVGDANITSLDAGKITTGTLDAGRISVINLSANSISGGILTSLNSTTRFNLNNGVLNIGNQLELSSRGLETYSGGIRTSLLDGSGQTFYRDNRPIGRIGTASWENDDNYRGLLFGLGYDADYMAWGHQRTAGASTYTTMLAWHKTDAKEESGFTFGDNVRINPNYHLKVNEIRTSSLIRPTRSMVLQSETFSGYNGVAFRRYQDGDDSAGLFVTTARVLLTTPTSSGSTTHNTLELTRNYLNALPVLNNTGGTSANVYVGSGGRLTRVSSAEKYKLLIEDEESKGFDYSKVLNLRLKSWYDKGTVERYAEYLNGINDREQSEDVDEIKRIYGLTAEDVIKAGLPEFVEYIDGEPEGLHYDRLWLLLIPIVREQQQKIEQLEREIALTKGEV